MKRLMMILAIAAAANLAAVGFQPAGANAAHHTGTKAIKAKKAKKKVKASQMMQCPMMKNMKGKMIHGRKMDGQMMKCPMMSKHHMMRHKHAGMGKGQGGTGHNH